MSNRSGASVSVAPAPDWTVLGGSRVTAWVSLLLCGVTLVFAYLNKARCAGPPFTAGGRSLIFDQIKDSHVCYSDIQYLWLGRDINEHVFPYLTGGITPSGQLTGGAVEYPVLSGLLMWIGARGVTDDAAFLLHTALLLAPFALLTAWLLGRLAGPAALVWSVGPALVLYAFHNWELPVVCTSVAAIYVVTALTKYSLRTRGVLAAVLLGIGCCLKIYPGFFVAPLLVYVLIHNDARWDRYGRRYDVPGALAVAGAALATVVAINLPFAALGYSGWRASFTFQELREADITTNSIWYWGLRPLFGEGRGADTDYHDVVSTASPVLVVVAFALALWLGWRRYLSTGVFPWVGVSGAMLCGFLLFHKVDSPQYTLWVVPFMILLEVRWSAVAAYLLADLALGIGVFRYFYALNTGHSTEIEKLVVQFGVWGRAALLLLFFATFLWAAPRVPPLRPPDATPHDELISVSP